MAAEGIPLSDIHESEKNVWLQDRSCAGQSQGVDDG